MILEIRDYFDALRQRATPNIRHFVCGCDEQSLRESIAQFDGIYMFVDYGAFSTNTDKNNCLDDGFELAVTIAYPIGSNAVTNDELLLFADQCFNYTAAIRKAMIEDKRSHPLIEKLSGAHSILPFVAPDISRSIGSTFTFKLTAFDMLGVK